LKNPLPYIVANYWTPMALYEQKWMNQRTKNCWA
jgi:hypothetical protein